MLPFLNDVRVIPLLADNAGTRIAVPSPPQTNDSEEAETSSQTGSSIHSSQHSGGSAAFIAIPITAIVFTFVYLIIKAIMAPFTQRAKYHRAPPPGSAGGGLTAEEVAVLQKLQRTLAQMESRVEALETILIDQARTEKNYGPKL